MTLYENSSSVSKGMKADYKLTICKYLSEQSDIILCSQFLAFKQYDIETELLEGIREFIDSFDDPIDFLDKIPEELLNYNAPLNSFLGEPNRRELHSDLRKAINKQKDRLKYILLALFVANIFDSHNDNKLFNNLHRELGLPLNVAYNKVGVEHPYIFNNDLLDKLFDNFIDYLSASVGTLGGIDNLDRIFVTPDILDNINKIESGQYKENKIPTNSFPGGPTIYTVDFGYAGPNPHFVISRGNIKDFYNEFLLTIRSIFATFVKNVKKGYLGDINNFYLTSSLFPDNQLGYITTNWELYKNFLKDLLFKNDDKLLGFLSFFFSMIGIDYKQYINYINEIETVKSVSNGKYCFNRDMIVKHIMIFAQIFIDQLEKIPLNISYIFSTIFIYVLYSFIWKYTQFKTSYDRQKWYGWLQLFSNIFLKIYTVYLGLHKKGFCGQPFLDDSHILFMIEVLHPNFFDISSDFYSKFHAIHKHDVYKGCITIVEKIQKFSKDLPYYLNKMPWLDKSQKGGVGIPRIDEYLKIRTFELINTLETLNSNYDINTNISFGKTNILLGKEILPRSPKLNELYNRYKTEYVDVATDLLKEGDSLPINKIAPYNLNRSVIKNSSNDFVYSITDTDNSPLAGAKGQKIKNQATQILEKLKKDRMLKLGAKIEDGANTFKYNDKGDAGDILTLKMYDTIARSKNGREFLKTIDFYNKEKKTYSEKMIVASERKLTCHWPTDFEIEKVKKVVIIGYNSAPRTYEDIVRFLAKQYPHIFGKSQMMDSYSSSTSYKTERMSHSMSSSSVITKYEMNTIFNKILNYIIESGDINDYSDINHIRDVVSSKIDSISGSSRDFEKFIRSYYKPTSSSEFYDCVEKFKDVATRKIFNKTQSKNPMVQSIKNKFLSSKYGKDLSINKLSRNELIQQCTKFVNKVMTPEWVDSHLEKDDISNLQFIKKDITQQLVQELHQQKSKTLQQSTSSSLNKWLSKELRSL